MAEVTTHDLTPDAIQSAVTVFGSICETVEVIREAAKKQCPDCRDSMLKAACKIAQAAIEMDSNVK